MCARPIAEQDAKWKTYLEVIGALVDSVEERQRECANQWPKETLICSERWITRGGGERWTAAMSLMS